MHLYSNVDRRFYTSVEPFYKDLALVLGKVVVGSSAIDLGEVLSQIVGDRGAKKDMTVDQKEMMKVARRIIKSIRPDVEEALRNEADLVGGEPTDLNRFEILDTTLPFDLGFVGAAGSVAPSVDGLAPDKPAEVPVDGDGDVYMGQEEVPVDPALEANGSATTTSKESHPTSPQFKAEHPPTPPLSSNSHHKSDVFVALTQGGVPSYMEGFEPRGTTISYEQWPDRDAMSEELSDMDEEELIGLVSDRDDMELDTVRVAVAEADDVKPEKKVPVARKKAAAARSRKKGGAGRR
jgi:NuA3 HAT complex component NTO1